jgi:hypothetical protein
MAFMHPTLRLFEDVLSSEAAEIELPPLPRMIFVVHGALTIDRHSLVDHQVCSGEDGLTLRPGDTGATFWRWELAAGDGGSGAVAARGVRSREKLATQLETLPAGRLLLRGDAVTFPPGGCAYLHRHQGPGIRCLLEGGIRIDTRGHSTAYGPGGAWYESGQDPVFAQAADRPTRFVRVMILPLAYLGKSSVEYLNEEDRAKPKSQQYQVFADLPLTVEAAR